MSQRMTITIPDKLKKRLDPYRTQLNLSQVCARALEREVSIMEGVASDPSEFNALVERVKLQKVQAARESFARGFEDGVEAAEDSDYPDFVLADRIRRDAGPYSLPDKAEQRLKALLKDSPEEVLDPEAYRGGWLDGMRAVWQRIEDQI